VKAGQEEQMCSILKHKKK